MNKETKLYTSDEKPHFRTDVFLYRLQIVKYCYLLCDNTMKNMVFRFSGNCDSPTLISFLNSMQEVFFQLWYYLFYFFDKSTRHTCDTVFKNT